MIEPRDEELSRIYRDAEALEPPQRVDDNILAASRRVAGASPRSARVGLARRWGAPVALAATVVVTFTLTLMVFERQSAVETMKPAMPPAGRPEKVSPPEPRRADPLAKSSPAELPSAAPALAPPIAQAAARRDRAEPRPGESAPSSERLGTGRRGFAADVPRTPSPDAQRAPEVLRQAARAPSAGLAGDANTLRESASTLQRAGVIGTTADRVAVSEARERTPEKWLEDIRKLKTQGKTAEAERELADFKKRHPDYRLPEDLR
jgi:hypothetical protein